MATKREKPQKAVKAAEIKSRKQLESLVRSGGSISFDEPYPQKRRRAKAPR